jgi:hypothetical protein
MKDDTTYEMFKLAPNQEFTFDVDLSNLPCGLNGALYFVSMDADGGLKKYSSNKAGAKYGTGYCDAQCPRDLKFINGEVSALLILRTTYSLTCVFRVMSKAGLLPPTTRMPALVVTALAALRWISG